MTTLSFEQLRCGSCNKLLAELVSAPYIVVCPRCGTRTSCLILATTEVVEGWRAKKQQPAG